MSSQSVVLVSDQPLEDVDRPFKLSAGPGAGKTHWLAEHVKAVLARGDRLHGRAKIACITYTQIGSETLAARLAGYEDRLWISTIHSFLYSHVVRPYAHLLGEADLATQEMDGHELRRPSISQGRTWLKTLGKAEGMWHASPQLASLLEKDVRWKRLEDGTWKLGFRTGARLAIRGGPGAFDGHDALLAYKRSHWKWGRIDHDDVIYLAHRVLLENDAVMRALVSRFPYLFMDEFQDTSRYQCEIVEALSAAGAVVGVIGDRKQAIYEFSDAEPALFDDFAPIGCLHCRIEGNRRSTAQIVQVLNNLRRDGLRQESIAEVPDGPNPVVIVGDLHQAVAYARKQCSGHELDLVARGHAGVTKLLLLDGQAQTSTIWTDCHDEEREAFLRVLCRALRHFEVGEGRQAVNALTGLFRGREVRVPLQGSKVAGEKQRRAFKVDLLSRLVSFRQAQPEATALQFYLALDEYLGELAWGIRLKRVKGGKFSAWAAGVSLYHLVASVSLEATRARARTIHGFKGDQTSALLVLLDDKSLRKKLSRPADTEEDRLIYVALSRAKERLFVAVTELPSSEETALRGMGFDIARL
jgi:DNA helicase-2/ATP-dependent DNA helicase PcrA